MRGQPGWNPRGAYGGDGGIGPAQGEGFSGSVAGVMADGADPFRDRHMFRERCTLAVEGTDLMFLLSGANGRGMAPASVFE